MVENNDLKWHSTFVSGWYISHCDPNFYVLLDIGKPFIIMEYAIAYFKSQLKSGFVQCLDVDVWLLLKSHI